MPAWHLEFAVHVRPGGSRDAVDGEFDGVLAVRVSAPAEAGRANRALVAVLAEAFGVPKRGIEIVSGAGSRRKRIRVTGSREELLLRHAALLRPGG